MTPVVSPEVDTEPPGEAVGGDAVVSSVAVPSMRGVSVVSVVAPSGVGGNGVGATVRAGVGRGVLVVRLVVVLVGVPLISAGNSTRSGAAFIVLALQSAAICALSAHVVPIVVSSS